MKRFIRKAAVYVWHTVICMAIAAWTVTALWAVCYATSVHRRHQAESLLQQLKSLQFGAAGLHRAQQIAQELGGVEHCREGLCNFDFETGFASPLILRRTEWDSIGLRPWRVMASIQTKKGEVTAIEFEALVGRGHGWLYNGGLFSGNMWAWWNVSLMVSSERFEQRLSLEKEFVSQNSIKAGQNVQPGTNGILVKRANLKIEGSGEALQVYLSPSATPESKANGFNINLRCTTTVLPCTELCQLAPLAWRSYSQFQTSNGWWAEQPDDCVPR